MPSTPINNWPLVLIVRDGWGENPHPAHDAFNAVKLARTPVDTRVRDEWPATFIRTCGEDVGLPRGTMGNSEVGHQNIGAGRVVDQELMRITHAIEDASFFHNPALLAAIEHAHRTNGAVHLLGLVSDGQVHSDLVHLLALIELASRQGVDPDRLFVHAFTDGRDTAPYSGRRYLREVEAALVGRGSIASVIGRFYAMDRDHRWERVAAAYACLTRRPPSGASDAAPRTARTSAEAIEQYYDTPSDANRTGDEFVLPTSIEPHSGATRPSRVADGDTVIFFNFRGDRPREITRAFVFDDDDWATVRGGGFERGDRLRNLHFCTMTEYERGLPVHVAFPRPDAMPDILGDVISRHDLRQFRCAETEKFPHVTFFFNDYREEPFPGEERRLIPSPRDVATYDQRPEMSAEGVTAAVLERLASESCEALLIVNFANADMVGHTGVLEAATRAVEVVDACVGRIIDATLARGGSLIVTADHGNAEQMWSPDHNGPHTAHTVYDVPLYVVGESFRHEVLRAGGRLGDLAPTILTMLGIPIPDAMTGRSLIERP